MNMHYCRFENTVNDMIDCIEDMDIFLPAADFPLMDGYSEAVAGLFTICL